MVANTPEVDVAGNAMELGKITPVSELKVTEAQPTVRADGVNDSERYLKRLCDRTFLSLWSYPGVYIDKGRVGGKGHGKEVCDLLVVFDKHIVIFSDKRCEFPDSGDLQLDWSRWYRRAVVKNAEQAWRAERWIRTLPDRLYLDRACTKPFPLALPEPAEAKIHRVVVAHGAAERCRQDIGGSGSLRIVPDEVGAPFVVGLVDPAKGFVHILDDTSLDLVLTELDTIFDLVTYFTKKEELLLSGRLESSAGEEDLLAHYLFPVEGKDNSDFITPPGVGRLTVPEGLWVDYEKDPYLLARREANAASYFWDELIEASSEQILANTQLFASHPGIRGGAEALRLLASESRTRRRLLSIAVRDFVMDTPTLPNYRAVRIMEPTSPRQPFYAFLQLSSDFHGLSEPEYREFRRNFLGRLCEVVKLRYSDAEDIVGIATELGSKAGRSQDIVYLNAREFTEADRTNAQKFAKAYALLTNAVRSIGTEYDYPPPGRMATQMPCNSSIPCMKGRSRNQPCPCGSGKKFKRCCGPLLEQLHARKRAA